MKICVAQIRPIPGNFDQNLVHHKTFVNLAASRGAEAIFFPELSLTGYEPTLAKRLAITPDDKKLDDFQTISHDRQLMIGVGAPTYGRSGILISMVIFQPGQPRQIYSKQILHADELAYFTTGEQPLVLNAKDKHIAPAICYESLQLEHAAEAVSRGANVYIASVAKSVNGVAKAYKHYPDIAKKYTMPVLMANCVGPCDDFESVGQSAIWNQYGSQLGQLDTMTEGGLLYDTETGKVIEITLASHNTNQ